jgi:peptidoglycan/LPS O-acetylase OafA/YrhL
VQILALLGNMTGLNGTVVDTLAANAPLWSLAYEIWFYIAAGTVAHLVTKGAKTASLFILSATCLVFSQLAASFLLYWCLGAAMVVFLNVRRAGALFVAGLNLTALAVVLNELASTSKSFVTIAYLADGVAPGMLCVGIAMLIPWLCSGRVNDLLRPIGPMAGLVASASYTIYLVHYPILGVLGHVFPKSGALTTQSVGYFIARIAICLLCAGVMYSLFERNTEIVRRWLRTAQGPVRTPALIPSS